jgi:hypothetical protein
MIVTAFSVFPIGPVWGQPEQQPYFRVALTPTAIMTVHERPLSERPPKQKSAIQRLVPKNSALPTSIITDASDLVQPGSSNAVSHANQSDAAFINQLLSVLQDALITNVRAQVSLKKVSVNQGKVHLGGVMLRNLDIGLRLSNKGARRLAGALYARYGQTSDAPSWARLLPLARAGFINDLEVNLQLEELSLRELDLDAQALQIEGLLVQAAAGAGVREGITMPNNDVLQAIAKLLQSIAVSRVEANISLAHVSAKHLRISLGGGALKNLRILVRATTNDL